MKDGKSLEIYIKGPKNHDVDIFFGGERFSYVDNFEFTSYIDSKSEPRVLINTVKLNVGVLTLDSQWAITNKPKIKEDTVRVVVENFNWPGNFHKVNVYIGENGVTGFERIVFQNSFEQPYNSLYLWPGTIKHYEERAIFYKFPKWVNIDFYYSQAVRADVGTNA